MPKGSRKSQRLFFNQVGRQGPRLCKSVYVGTGQGVANGHGQTLTFKASSRGVEVGILQEGLRPPPKMHACTERAKSGRSPSPLPYRSELQSSAAEHFPLAPIYPAPFPPSPVHPVSLCNEHFRLIYEGGLVEDGKTHFSRSAGCSAVGCTGVSAREGSDGRLPIWLRAKAKWVFESGRSRSHPFFACKWEFKSGRGFSPSRPESE